MNKATWQLDKHIPIALIGAVMLQLAVVVWCMSKFDSRMSSVEALAATNSSIIALHTDKLNQSNIALIKITISLEQIQETLKELKKR